MTKQCDIKWNSLSPAEWQSRFASIRRSNLLQCYEYALAVCPINSQSARWGLITIDGAEAGLVQIFEVTLLSKLVHVVILDRGPLWFDGFGSATHWKAFFARFDMEFKPRFGRSRRIMPETHLQIYDYARKRAYPPYQTIWLDLTQDEIALRANMRKSWRNALAKAERSDLEMRDDLPEKHIIWLLNQYAADRTARGYQGPSVKMIMALAKTFHPRGQMHVMRALKDEQVIAGILIFTHGRSATYQIGWTSPDAGRKYNAHHFLLWQAILKLKEQGITDFDLGGVNDFSAAGVKLFKEGLGGESIELCGQYK
ncbi:MAG: GNAT family N-acetyltransferase [Alphaproteobacteria bacterium]|nr:GNAT family N-acetyltransferase [Alphaproteobacteria bacterium]|tara:strand:+ start:295620 stop:296555 length:936 start_codon:yes stop_codon:yes gene_type:complete